jgi:molecular chaperone HscB
MVNYFELYGLSETFNPDSALLKKRYYELSRQYHPDRFTQAGEAERIEALRVAAINNDAYKVLSNADLRMAYILKLNGHLEDEEKYNLPPSFLMEMMELNEAVSEYEMNEEESLRNTAEAAITEQNKQWETEVKPLTEAFDSGNRSDDILLKIKDYYFRKKYLLRIQQRIDTFASR